VASEHQPSEKQNFTRHRHSCGNLADDCDFADSQAQLALLNFALVRVTVTSGFVAAQF
jgi:hypothetical protein